MDKELDANQDEPTLRLSPCRSGQQAYLREQEKDGYECDRHGNGPLRAGSSMFVVHVAFHLARECSPQLPITSQQCIGSQRTIVPYGDVHLDGSDDP